MERKEKKERLVKITMYHPTALKIVTGLLHDYGYNDHTKTYWFVTSSAIIGNTKPIVQKHFVPDNVTFEVLEVHKDCLSHELISALIKDGYYEELVILSSDIRHGITTSRQDVVADPSAVLARQGDSQMDRIVQSNYVDPAVELDRLTRRIQQQATTTQYAGSKKTFNVEEETFSLEGEEEEDE